MCEKAHEHLLTAIGKREALVSSFGEATTIWRIVHSSPDGFYGLTLDNVGSALLLEQHREEIEVGPLLDAISKVFPNTPVVLKRRWSRAGRNGELMRGSLESSQFLVKENGLQFHVQLLGGEHIGFFLDTRPVREYVQRISRDKRVLNLFSYTGAFGAYAAKGGALSTVNIDNKNSAIQMGKRNYDVNGLPYDNRSHFKCDVLYYLKRAARQNATFDVIIIDPPPKFKRRKQRDFESHRDYHLLLSLVLPLLNSNGCIIAGLNSLKATEFTLDEMVQRVNDTTSYDLKVVDTLGAPSDFPIAEDRPVARFKIITPKG